MIVHYIPPENLWTFIALYVEFTVFLVRHRSILSARIFLVTKLEALNEKIYLKSDRETQPALLTLTARDATSKSRAATHTRYIP